MKYFFRFLTLPVLMLLAAGNPLFAANAVDFDIRFFDKRIYYAEVDPVLIQITVTNKGPEGYRFKLADERAFSIDFDVRTVNNRGLEAANELIKKRTTYQQVFFREVIVESGESFSFIEDLRDYVDLKHPGSYVVQAQMYPDLIRPLAGNVNIAVGAANLGNNALISKRLNLNIRAPITTGPDGIPLEMDIDTGAVLVRERMPPDQVVDYMLTAQQKSQWEKFFLYLDLEAMLARDAFQKRRWNAEGEEGRRRMVAQFRQEMQSEFVDGDIAMVPFEFTIGKTTYNSRTGEVEVVEKFRIGTYTEVRQYIYELEQKDNIWAIVNYRVKKLGSE